MPFSRKNENSWRPKHPVCSCRNNSSFRLNSLGLLPVAMNLGVRMVFGKKSLGLFSIWKFQMKWDLGRFPPCFDKIPNFLVFLKERVAYGGCRIRPAQHPSHSLIAFWFAMNKFSAAILLFLLSLQISTASKTGRKSIVGHLIRTKPGNLFLAHSNKKKKLTSGKNI